jgi:flagellar hook assembly protein FlgD
MKHWKSLTKIRARPGEANRLLRPALACGAVLALYLTGNGQSEASTSSGISSVSLSKAFFNPSLEQKIGISFAVGRSGLLTLSVLDRDGRVARRLAFRQRVRAGRLSYAWDGRDSSGHVVLDGAYSLKIELLGPGERGTYLPRRSKAKPVKVETTFYDGQNGIVGYKLSAPARVSIDAASYRVSRAIIRGQPRTAGSVVDNWNGYDESGKEYIPALPGFSLSISAEALPENAIITVGNRPSTTLARMRGRP